MQKALLQFCIALLDHDLVDNEYQSAIISVSRPVLGLCLEDELNQRNALDAVVSLLEAGADPSLRNYIGHTACDLSLLNGNLNIAHLLANTNSSAAVTNATASVKPPDTLAQKWLLPSINSAS